MHAKLITPGIELFVKPGLNCVSGTSPVGGNCVSGTSPVGGNCVHGTTPVGGNCRWKLR